MPLFLLMASFAAAIAQVGEACPDDASIRSLKRDNTALERALTAPTGEGLDEASGQVRSMLGCVPDLPPSVVAQSFLLLGATYMQQGDAFRATPYISAAALLGGERAWNEALGPELRTRFFNGLRTDRPRGVVYAPESALGDDFHLVGSQGPPPWLMPVGTFTFEWGDRTVPVNVNERELSLVTAKTFDEFAALVDGVTEADLEEPDYDQPVFYDRRAERKAKRERELAEREAQPPADAQQPDQPDEPPVDAEDFFDELAFLEDDEKPAQPLTPDQPVTPERPERSGLGVRPHLGVGGAFTITGPASDSSPVGDASYGGLGLQAELGLRLLLGERLALRPELGFRSAGSSADLSPGLFAEEGWDAGVPVEPQRDRLMLGYARMPLLLQLGAVSVGAGPAWAMGQARVTALTACGDANCVASMRGTVMAAGGSLLLGLRPGASSVVPWLDLGMLHDGERANLSAGLVLSWEGSP